MSVDIFDISIPWGKLDRKFVITGIPNEKLGFKKKLAYSLLLRYVTAVHCRLKCLGFHVNPIAIERLNINIFSISICET